MKLERIKLMLQSMLASFKQVSTDKGLITWDGDNELPEVGQNVYGLDEEGNEVALENGEYTLEDGTIIVVEDGKVTEIRTASDDETAEETPEETPEDNGNGADEAAPSNGGAHDEDGDNLGDLSADEPESDEERIANLEAEIARLERENGELRERIKELEAKPAAEPAEEEFKRVNKVEKTGNRKLDNLIRIVNA